MALDDGGDAAVALVLTDNYDDDDNTINNEYCAD